MKIKSILTPEQLVKYDANKTNQKEIRKEERKERVDQRLMKNRNKPQGDY